MLARNRARWGVFAGGAIWHNGRSGDLELAGAASVAAMVASLASTALVLWARRRWASAGAASDRRGPPART